MARRRKGRPVNGILVVNKPPGISSNEAVQKAKRLYGAQKVGHTGSLDPLATGVLPLCFGEATKFSQFLLDADKRYQATFQLGVITDSGDADGKVLETRPVPEISDSELESVLENYGISVRAHSVYSLTDLSSALSCTDVTTLKTLLSSQLRSELYAEYTCNRDHNKPYVFSINLY